MTIIKRRRTEDYSIVPNEVAEDRRLSLEARGLLVYLLAKPSHWLVQIDDIRATGHIGREKAHKLLKELQSFGYMKVERKRTSDNQFAVSEYIVYDCAIPAPQGERRSADHVTSPTACHEVTDSSVADNSRSDLPQTAEPFTGFPSTAQPSTGNPPAIVSTKNKTNTHVVCGDAPERTDPHLAAPFEVFWQSYPHKVGKREAEKAFVGAIKRASLEAIMAGVHRYASKTDDRPWCNPSTFLNQDRWSDIPAAPIIRQSPPRAPRTAGEAAYASLEKSGAANVTDEFKSHLFGGDTGRNQERHGNAGTIEVPFQRER